MRYLNSALEYTVPVIADPVPPLKIPVFRNDPDEEGYIITDIGIDQYADAMTDQGLLSIVLASTGNVQEFDTMIPVKFADYTDNFYDDYHTYYHPQEVNIGQIGLLYGEDVSNLSPMFPNWYGAR